MRKEIKNGRNYKEKGDTFVDFACIAIEEKLKKEGLL